MNKLKKFLEKFKVIFKPKNINLIELFGLDKYTKQAILIAGIFIFLISNIIGSEISLRLDLSQGQVYTLTQSTKKILKDLDKDAKITFYASSDLPTILQPAKREVVDLLREYARASGKVQFVSIDPKKNDKDLKEAQGAGIQEIPFQQMQQNKYEVSSGFFGILIKYKDGQESIPQISDLGSLEYDISSAMYKLSRKELPKIGIIETQSGYFPQQGDPLATLKSIVKKQFDLQTITLPAKVEEGAIEPEFKIENGYKTIIAIEDVNHEYTDTEKTALAEYLNDKGSMVIMANGVQIDDNFQTVDKKSILSDILEKYGIKLEKNLVLSAQSELVNFGGQGVSYLVPYPYWLRTNVFDQKAPYFSGVRLLTFPWVSSISISKKEGFEIRDLVNTTIQSWSKNGIQNLDPQTLTNPTEKDLNEYPIVAESKKVGGGKILAIGSSRFVLDRFLSKTSNNIEFILNILNEYASGGALSGIRQRVVNIYPLPVIAQKAQDVFKYANILTFPLLFGLYGFVRLYKRNKKVSNIS